MRELADVDMKLTYVFHSGFIISGERASVIIDYFQDSDGRSGVVRDFLDNHRGPVYVLCSHGHADHFNPTVLGWKQVNPEVRYIFSDDIRRSGLENDRDIVFMNPGEKYRDHSLSVRTFGSTDLGVSFLIELGGYTLFHAGDLNNWHWREESTPEESQQAETDFLNELMPIERSVDRLDLALFPVDERLGRDYMLGAEQFIRRIPTRVFAPMHFGDSYEKASAFKMYAEAHGCRFITWHYRGESVVF